MRWRISALILTVIFAGQATAQQPAWRMPWHGLFSPTKGCPPLGCCPDDYCRKPCPLVPTVRCGGPDDYCRKAMPCIADLPRCGFCDDYCRKTLPALLCPPLTPYLQCGPAVCPPTGHR